jgi:hypothetical protein
VLVSFSDKEFLGDVSMVNDLINRWAEGFQGNRWIYIHVGLTDAGSVCRLATLEGLGALRAHSDCMSKSTSECSGKF